MPSGEFINMKKLELKNIKKTYNETIVLDGFSALCDSSKPSCIMGESGAGKTTLLNIIMGLVSADSGTVGYSFQSGTVKTDGGYRTSAVFQETSLVPHLNPVINVAMVLGNNSDKKRINQELGCLIDEEFLDKPCAQYSGGMKRRVEIVRAIMADSDIVVMDEPFAGLDDTTKNKVIGYIMDNIGDRILIISTHDLSDAEKLGANVFFVGA